MHFGLLVWRPRQRADLAELLPQFLPRVTPVAAEVDVAVEAVGHDDVWVCQVCRKPVDRRVRLYRQWHRFPIGPSSARETPQPKRTG